MRKPLHGVAGAFNNVEGHLNLDLGDGLNLDSPDEMMSMILSGDSHHVHHFIR
jgi:hypothetical protein